MRVTSLKHIHNLHNDKKVINHNVHKPKKRKVTPKKVLHTVHTYNKIKNNHILGKNIDIKV